MTADLSQDDRGKTVVYQNKRVGVVTDVRGGTASVDIQDSNVPDRLRDALDWTDDETTIDESAVTDIRNNQLHLRTDLAP